MLTSAGEINKFLASPEPMWCMPADVRGQLAAPGNANVALVICKGDLMYRKLLGDRSWNTEECFADVLSYFPSPVVALRTCKSPLAVGMKPGQDREVSAKSPQWMVNGEYGMVQFSAPPPSPAVSVMGDGYQVRYDASAIESQWNALVK